MEMHKNVLHYSDKYASKGLQNNYNISSMKSYAILDYVKRKCPKGVTYGKVVHCHTYTTYNMPAMHIIGCFSILH